MALGDLLDAAPTIVVFLADAGTVQTPDNTSRRLEASDRVGMALLPLFMQSAQAVYPEARFAVLTTPATRLPSLAMEVQEVRRPIGSGPLTYERMQAYAQFLDAATDSNTYVFLESDMLVLRRLRTTVAADWDVALLYKNGGMLINSGVIIVRRGRRRAALAFLRRALELYEQRHLSHPRWGSDQLALRDAAGLTAAPAAPRVQVTETAAVLLLDREVIAPFASKGSAALYRRSEGAILHFSGRKAKKMMPVYYRLHLGPAAPVGRLVCWGADVVRGVKRRVHRARQASAVP